MPGPIHTAEQAIEFLHSRIDYERMSASLSASDFKLDRMRNLLRHLGNPQLDTPVVHIAGTKGKGSTAAMVSQILVEAGLRVGLFTSPHLDRFEERIRIDGVPIEAAELVELVNEVAIATAEIDSESGNLKPTFFELTTAIGWLAFRQRGVQIAVLEVGLGGRLDSTNICQPEVCAITSISRDHTHILGSQLSQIAAEKAGIIKPGIAVVCGQLPGEADAKVRQIAASQDSPVVPPASEADVEIPSHLAGDHQRQNAAVAVAIVKQLQIRGWTIPESAVAEGLKSVRWPARVEVMSRQPLVILDAAHNWASCGALLNSLKALHEGDGRRILIFATSADKDAASLLRRLVPEFDTVILTAFQSNPRAMPLDELSRVASQIAGRQFHLAADPSSAWKAALLLSQPDSLICVAGSFFLAAELRQQIAEEVGKKSSIRSTAVDPA
ncbi:MAG: bifunctional folylpolyglutamate synthase/dihydrofolate synthase [Planctomycetes bacterium]|nr:bifunctional folylpolyglutamate synthase/dihydrofolate synthase [Planctomycetota bacterium]